MRHGSRAIAALALAQAGAALAADRSRFDVAAGPLGVVAAAIARQGGATIAVPDPATAARPSPGVRGVLPLRAALDRALRGTGATAVVLDARTIRIVATPARQPPPPRAAPVAPPLEAATPPEDIVVTASKQPLPQDRYPGSATVFVPDRGWTARNAAQGTAALVDLLPSMGATNLGPARDKLFIRGIADSSVNGPTQATVGQYLGDVRLNYSAPDPNLNLYDLERVEVLVGPQGALYGAGSLGGIVRLVPHAPDAGEAAASALAGVSGTRHGGLGGDLAAMVDVPLVADRLAVRAVASAAWQPGYIDAPAQGRRGINATRSVGQRLALRWSPPSGWLFDLGGVIQNSGSDDGQYTRRGDPPLTRDDPVPQPFRNDYYLGYVTATGAIGDAELVSTTSLVSHRLRSVFDATGHDGTRTPARFVEDDRVLLLDHETRVSGGGTRSPWVAGAATVFSGDASLRTLGPVDAPAPAAGVLNTRFEGALFGEASRPLGARLTGTLGGRVTLATGTGRLVSDAGLAPQVESRTAVRFSGTLALDWRASDRLSAFFHYQQGYRAGGLAVSPTGTAPAARRFAADDLNMNELGIRLGREGRDRVTVRAAIFAADWNFIQADLVDAAGLPYTANIGRGRIVGLDATATWRLSPSLAATGSVFVNYSDLYAPAPGYGGPGPNPLPNVPANGQRLALDWRRRVRDDLTLSAQASVRYVGPSRLGVAPVLDIAQGGYGVAAIGMRIDRGRIGVGLDVQNLTDVRANSFAFGNPFGVAARDQVTPLRPRTVRLSLEREF